MCWGSGGLGFRSQVQGLRVAELGKKNVGTTVDTMFFTLQG